MTGEEASRVSVLPFAGAANNIFPPCLLPLITIRVSGNDAEGLGRVGKGHEDVGMAARSLETSHVFCR